MILFLLQAPRNIFLLKLFFFYENNIWHSKYAFSPPNANIIRSLIAYFKRYPYHGLKKSNSYISNYKWRPIHVCYDRDLWKILTHIFKHGVYYPLMQRARIHKVHLRMFSIPINSGMFSPDLRIS